MFVAMNTQWTHSVQVYSTQKKWEKKGGWWGDLWGMGSEKPQMEKNKKRRRFSFFFSYAYFEGAMEAWGTHNILLLNVSMEEGKRFF